MYLEDSITANGTFCSKWTLRETKKLLAAYIMKEEIKTQAVLSSVVCKPIKSETKGMKSSFYIAICRPFMQNVYAVVGTSLFRMTSGAQEFKEGHFD